MRANMIIRSEVPQDITQVQDIIIQAFQNVLESDHQEQVLVAKLCQTDAFIPELSLVASINDELVGHLLLTKINIINNEQTYPSLALAPLSVLPKWQRQGIGSALIKEAHQRARSLGFTSIAVLGHTTYYPKFGYRPANEFGITFPFEVPKEFCMMVELCPQALLGKHGVIQYAPPFYE